MYSLDNGSELQKKRGNWEYLVRFFLKKEIPIKEKDWDPVMHGAPDAAIRLIKKIYGLLTNKELKEMEAQAPVPLPPHARLTATLLLRDNELQRIEDKPTQTAKAFSMLEEHKQRFRLEKTEPGRLAEPKFIPPVSQTTQRVSVKEEAPIVKEIEVKSVDKNLAHLRATKGVHLPAGHDKSMNGSSKSDQKTATQNDPSGIPLKPLADWLIEILSDAELTTHSSAQLNMQDIEQGEVYIRGFLDNLKDKKAELVTSFFDGVSRRADPLVDLMLRSSSDYKSFVDLFMPPVNSLKHDSDAFMKLIEAMTSLGEQLEKQNALMAERLFHEYFLDVLGLAMFTHEHKREVLCHLFHCFSGSSIQSQIRALRRLSRVATGYHDFVRCLAHLVKYEKELNEELHGLITNYAKLGLGHSSPHTRSAALAVFSHMATLSPGIVLDVINNLRDLSVDSWWEVKAQVLQCCGTLLTTLDPSPEPETERNINNIKAIIMGIFTPNAFKNVLRVGIVYIAGALGKHPDLSDRFVECLVAAPRDVRTIVLAIKSESESLTPDEGHYVIGSAAQRYRIGEIPLVWNSSAVASSLANFVHLHNLETLDEAHTDILTSTLLREPTDQATWLPIFDILKDYLYVGLCDPDICYSCIQILKSMLTAKVLSEYTIRKSKETFLKALHLLFVSVQDQMCRENTYEFLRALYWNYELADLKELVFQILKTFSEKYADLFEKTQLVEIMNEIIGHRRGDIFGEDARADSPMTTATYKFL